MGLSGFHNLLISSLNLDFKICLWASYVTKVFQKEDSAHRGNKEVHSVITLSWLQLDLIWILTGIITLYSSGSPHPKVQKNENIHVWSWQICKEKDVKTQIYPQWFIFIIGAKSVIKIKSRCQILTINFVIILRTAFGWENYHVIIVLVLDASWREPKLTLLQIRNDKIFNVPNWILYSDV